MWEELIEEYGEDIDLVTVDRDSADGRRFAESHGIHYQPGFVAIDSSGTTVHEGLGPYDPEAVRELVLSLLPDG